MQQPGLVRHLIEAVYSMEVPLVAVWSTFNSGKEDDS
jgi:hypothetical protein